MNTYEAYEKVFNEFLSEFGVEKVNRGTYRHLTRIAKDEISPVVDFIIDKHQPKLTELDPENGLLDYKIVRAGKSKFYIINPIFSKAFKGVSEKVALQLYELALVSEIIKLKEKKKME